MAELSTIATASVFSQVYPLQKPDYSKDVTEASNKAFVLVHLTSSLGTNIESRLLSELWRELSRKFGDIKFCEIQADMCIESYPERNTPTILVYKDGDIKKQVVTLKELGGEQTTIQGGYLHALHLGHQLDLAWPLTELRSAKSPRWGWRCENERPSRCQLCT